MAIYKGQWVDDETGNVFYSHTSTDVVINSAGKNVDALLNEKSNSNHTHDDRYYTETEMNTKLNAKLDATGNASNVTNTFTQSSTLTNLSTGEKLSASLGKTMKAIADFISHIGNKANPHGVTKAQIGLSNVTNDAQVKRSEMGKASGVATLDTSGKVPSSQLPSYVDDVLEYTNKSSFPSTGESGKIYVDTTANKSYRWGGTTYIEISASLALGETSSTAYAGNKGKTTTDNVDAILAGTKAVPKAKDTEMFDGHTSQYYGKQTDVTAIKSQLNRNLISLTNSSYYPNANLYRSGQACYLRCAGYLAKDVTANSELTIGTASMMPSEYRPGTDLVFYITVINNGTIIEVRIYTDGRVTFVSPQKLTANTPINLHLSYMTGKSNL
nr:MAG TPA: Peptidase [Caudoviricetes sp.]